MEGRLKMDLGRKESGSRAMAAGFAAREFEDPKTT